MLKSKQDAFGLEILEFYEGQPVPGEIIERDDGLVTIGYGPRMYFSEFRNWRPHEKKAAKFARGRILDIGCGAGRVALYFQNKGHRVTGIDTSPLAIKVCKKRGLKDARIMSITQINKSLGIFDTITMFGNNFGLFGNFSSARRLLRKFHTLTSANARVIAESLDPYDTDEQMHQVYHRRNRQKGRPGGQIRLRVRYKMSATPWFDYLLVSESEARKILKGTGWQLLEIIRNQDFGGTVPAYMMVIGKTQSNAA